MTTGKRLHVIYNPMAGRRHGRRFQKVLEGLEQAGCDIVLHHTSGPAHATELAIQASEDDTVFAVIAAGGDGTLGEVAQGLRGSEVPLGIIPLGTANVFAHEIGIGTNITKIVNAIVAGEATQIWPGWAQNKRFLLMLGCGYDSLAVHALDIDQKRKWGAVAYLLAAIRARNSFSKMNVSVQVGGETYRAASVVVSRARKYGGPFTVFPKANLESRDFQVLLLKHGGRLAALSYAVALGLNYLPKLKSVEMFSAIGDVLICSEPALPCQRDGDAEKYTPIRLSVDRTPLYILMPK
ncbi:diacylglycerol/lipid kinase family protein [Sneathiella glossodoripedis]|uniref:diacylglycerol/lipid kinase family protein n=1 Tax=Sneathiella glossodoripedis TaxID=418853 RepID=UPI000470B140|nr:YegS/Rv2252/BmrU family lipid kinase [Sneathiella glossodoripedis]